MKWFNKRKKVVVAMSGGVDSSVAAALLKKQGYDVTGVFMQFWYPEGANYGENRCCSLESWHEAQEVARLIGIPIFKVNFGQQFKQLIVDEFLNSFKQGLTPNPCVACNKFVKFDLLLNYARTVLGADFLATGHYIRLERKFSIFNFQFSNNATAKSRARLSRSKDKNKDQTYFLYNLKQAQLKHLMFPLGGYDKSEVRRLAKKFKLPMHDKADSQEICFVGNSHYDFLNQYLELKPGEIVDEENRVIGQHQGLALYTLGQRSGIKLSGGPWYVAGFDQQKNQLRVSHDPNDAGMMKKIVNFSDANWLAGDLATPKNCTAQIRYHAKAEKCVVTRDGDKWQVEFAAPVRAAMPGQSIVFYEGDELLGGGVIGI